MDERDDASGGMQMLAWVAIAIAYFCLGYAVRAWVGYMGWV